jgi:hypothetical protein
MKRTYLVAVVDTSSLETEQLSVRIPSGDSSPAAVRGERPNPALEVGSMFTRGNLKKQVIGLRSLHLQACSEFMNI